MTPPEIFDRAVRRRQYGRVLQSDDADRWLLNAMAGELLERLEGVKRTFDRALIIGPLLPRLRTALTRLNVEIIEAGPASAGIIADEDRLPFADQSFDLIIAIETLATVNDLPGALILARRALRPEGMFLAAFAGAASAAGLRAIFADIDPAIARFHPQIDVRAAGDLLARAGFQLPVADTFQLRARYPILDRLLSDLRTNGMRNMFAHRHPLARSTLAQARRAFGSAREESFEIMVLTGWSPSA